MGAQVLSGIGFIGAGSIMKTGRNQVRGITTAAGLWAAAMHRSGYWHRLLRSCHCRRHPDFHCVVAHAEHGLLYTETYKCH
ncbi:MAG: MgtC/SapB family protein [Faecalibacterium sp.]